jgi:hypothetical protein
MLRQRTQILKFKSGAPLSPPPPKNMGRGAAGDLILSKHIELEILESCAIIKKLMQTTGRESAWKFM